MYCFICLFRADKAASGLAFRIPLLWKEISHTNKNVFLITNKSLYDKVLIDLDDNLKSSVFIIPEFFGFKLSSLFFTPIIIIYLFLLKKINKYHVSVGGVYFIGFLKFLSKIFNKNIVIHTSIGSKNLEMITNGDHNHRYYKLHKNLLGRVDKVDSLYHPDGFPEYKDKFIQSPGSFSWKFDTDKIISMNLPKYKEKDIVFCGSLIDQKNYRLAIDGYKALCKKLQRDICPNLYIIAPSIPSSITKECEEFNKTSIGNILFENYKNLNDLLRRSYIFLSLQDFDNYPSQSLIEAMVNGCTVIATDFGETRKLVQTSNGNILIDKDITQLSEAIESLLTKESLVNYGNLQFILNNHTLEKYSEYFYDNFVREK